MPDTDPLQVWIDHVFDHPVTEPEWYRAEDAPATVQGEEDWPEPSAAVADHISETFENPTQYLARFSGEQLDQGFWYQFGNSHPRFMDVLYDPSLPLDTRMRCLRSFVPLFEQLMAPRCLPVMSTHNESGRPLNTSCYMWFDEIPDRFEPWKVLDAGLGPALVAVLKSILAIPHDACRESALHGIGHWIKNLESAEAGAGPNTPATALMEEGLKQMIAAHPEFDGSFGAYTYAARLQNAQRAIDQWPTIRPQLIDAIDQFLVANAGLRPELVEYANKAKQGAVL